MPDPARISLYTDEVTRAALEERAEEHDTTLSEHCMAVLRDHLDNEQAREIDAETRVEEAMEEIVSIGKDELRQTARDIADMNARMGVYAVANFELLKEQYPDTKRRDALSVGSRRLQKSLDDDLAAAIDSGDLDADASATASAEDDTADDDNSGSDSVFDITRGDE